MKKRIISLVLAIMCMCCAVIPARASATPYTDVNSRDWFYDTIAYVYGLDLISGTSSTTFSPRSPMLREDTVVALGRIAEKAGKTVTGSSNPFADVSEDSGYYKYVCWAYENGIVDGMSPTVFGVGRSVTRQDFCTMIYRFATNYLNVPIQDLGGTANFSDETSIASYAKTAVMTCVKGKVVNGYGDGTFKPRNAINRAEAAYMITSYVQFHIA